MRFTVMALLVLGACSDKDAEDSDASVGLCDDAPIANWNSFGDAFMTRNCQSCHASTTPERYAAPDDITFDTVEETWALADRVLERAAAEPPTMPPEGVSTEDERYLLKVWLTCAEPGT